MNAGNYLLAAMTFRLQECTYTRGRAQDIVHVFRPGREETQEIKDHTERYLGTYMFPFACVF